MKKRRGNFIARLKAAEKHVAFEPIEEWAQGLRRKLRSRKERLCCHQTQRFNCLQEATIAVICGLDGFSCYVLSCDSAHCRKFAARLAQQTYRRTLAGMIADMEQMRPESKR